ncbi:sigma-70 family RNA polymerase sigma factor [Ornithinibacillus halophilus]|uniref:RNA polymerase sigma-70 factor, ECF subfamily n=1 Tax=Ornithinibacillus halophilus TaxID=930117 RepID=A0A1M5L6N2_9BACI|nr:sigma-70 family RNA polymerase sigma factor [Ornithinibacillus halophilus]SHG60073.1 RNA polymerase sigma-70 factor, ECF subfamily [Ornithinibacillus halophilus]
MDQNRDISSWIQTIDREQAMEWIMEEYGESLKRFIFTYTKNRAQTDDIFQEVLLTVYRKIETYQGKASFKNWLYQVTANKCKDYLRSPIHRLITWKDQIKEKSDAQTPEQSYLQDEQKQIVIEAILNLPIKYREVLILQYYKEFSIQEISDTLKVNPSTIKTRIMRAKEKLKTELKGEFIYE